MKHWLSYKWVMMVMPLTIPCTRHGDLIVMIQPNFLKFKITESTAWA